MTLVLTLSCPFRGLFPPFGGHLDPVSLGHEFDETMPYITTWHHFYLIAKSLPLNSLSILE